jgi:hypothetical protein
LLLVLVLVLMLMLVLVLVLHGVGVGLMDVETQCLQLLVNDRLLVRELVLLLLNAPVRVRLLRRVVDAVDEAAQVQGRALRRPLRHAGGQARGRPSAPSERILRQNSAVNHRPHLPHGRLIERSQGGVVVHHTAPRSSVRVQGARAGRGGGVGRGGG